MALHRLSELCSHFAYVNMWSPNADVLKCGELWIRPLDLCIVIGNELLYHMQVSILQVLVSAGSHFLNFLEVVDTDVLIAIVLEDFSSDFFAFVAICVDKMTVLTTGAPVGSVVVAARNCAKVAWLDQ